MIVHNNKKNTEDRDAQLTTLWYQYEAKSQILETQHLYRKKTFSKTEQTKCFPALVNIAREVQHHAAAQKANSYLAFPLVDNRKNRLPKVQTHILLFV